jgi:hypothetical protein
LVSNVGSDEYKWDTDTAPHGSQNNYVTEGDRSRGMLKEEYNIEE